MLRVRCPWQLYLLRYRRDGRVGKDEAFSLIGNLWYQRRTFASVSHDEGVERLEVKCGSSGSIFVDLYNSKALSTPTNPLTIYLPPTGTHLKTHHPSIPPFLFSSSSALASINYRWNIPSSRHHIFPSSPKPLSSHSSFTNHPFPTPLHDTLHAYSHLITLLQIRFSPQPPAETPLNDYWSTQTHREKKIPRPILVYGSYLGGTLATSLALTETFSSRTYSTYITGLIAKNAVYDWSSIATTAPPASKIGDEEQDFSHLIRNNQPWTPSTLHALKHNLFTNPVSCFDNFVSPILFFYSAGVIPPTTWLSEDGNDTDAQDDLRVDVSIPSSQDETPASSPTSSSRKTATTMDLQTTRSSHLKFPPRDSKLRIPRSLFLASSSPSSSSKSRSSASKLATRTASKSKTKGTGKKKEEDAFSPSAQATEMARLMRRSIVLYEFKDRTMYDSDFDAHAVSEERVSVEDGDCDGDVRKEEEVVREWIEDGLGK